MSPRHLACATHAAPPPGFTITPCCGVTPTALPRFHGVTPTWAPSPARDTPSAPCANSSRSS